VNRPAGYNISKVSNFEQTAIYPEWQCGWTEPYASPQTRPIWAVPRRTGDSHVIVSCSETQT